jgi:long-chain acyl-CoA synthetase
MFGDQLEPNSTPIANSGVRLLITTTTHDLQSPQSASTFSSDSTIDVVSMQNAMSEGEKLKAPDIKLSLDDLAVLQYTGGTTGVAKGAMLCHGNIIACIAQSRKHFAEDGDSSISGLLIAPLPLYHIFGFSVYLCGNFASGGRSVLIPNPRDVDGLLDVMKSVPFTGFAAVNTMLVGLMANPKFDEVDWSHLQWTIAGGAALVVDVAEQWERLTDSRLVEGYGLSETTANLTLNTPAKRRIGSAGRTLPFQEVKLVDTNGNEVPNGTEGEIWVRGPQVMMGYWGRPDATADAIDQDGFFKTGDVAVRLDDGYYKIVDRIKDMILVSGFNVYPNEIESVLCSHPDVLECAIVGVKDDRSGEAVKAFVVRKEHGLTETELIDFCRKNLTAYKVPKLIEFRSDLPKSNVGKILRRELRQ